MNQAAVTQVLKLATELAELAVEHGPDVVDVVRWAAGGCDPSRKPDAVARLHETSRAAEVLREKMGR
jgi:hypothetical protein